MMRVGTLLIALAVSVPLAASSSRSVWDGAYTEEQAKRGEAIYYSRCAACHGSEQDGGDMTPPLKGSAFTGTWNDLTVGDLVERVRVSMPLDNPGSLSRQQTVDVVSFVLKTNGWPAGDTELPRESEPLKDIQIKTAKP